MAIRQPAPWAPVPAVTWPDPPGWWRDPGPRLLGAVLLATFAGNSVTAVVGPLRWQPRAAAWRCASRGSGAPGRWSRRRLGGWRGDRRRRRGAERRGDGSVRGGGQGGDVGRGRGRLDRPGPDRPGLGPFPARRTCGGDGGWSGWARTGRYRGGRSRCGSWPSVSLVAGGGLAVSGNRPSAGSDRRRPWPGCRPGGRGRQPWPGWPGRAGATEPLPRPPLPCRRRHCRRCHLAVAPAMGVRSRGSGRRRRGRR